MGELTELSAVSAIDGRYRSRVSELSEHLSEFGLIKNRVRVECALLIAYTSGALPDVPNLGEETHKKIERITSTFSEADAHAIKDIEKQTNHDVKAVELWLRAQFENDAVIGRYLELIHFGVTSEDINNNAYNLMLTSTKDEVIVPNFTKVVLDLDGKSKEYADVPMLGQTHGQDATPTTVGKEIKVFANRLDITTQNLAAFTLTGKLNGATGTYSAMAEAYPEVNWPLFAKTFVENLGFKFNRAVTQIETHDSFARLFNELSVGNGQIIDLSRDMWEYISRGIFKLKVKEGETGSSAMPHKVNPIDFENAEGKAAVANALFRMFADKLVISREQRDLSDSTVKRDFGEAIGHQLVALKSLQRGLSKVDVNKDAARRELENNWAVLTEAIQTVGRRYGVEDIYNKIKKASRGKELDEMGYKKLVNNLEIPEDAKQSLLTLTPATYIGKAPEIARGVEL